LERRHDSGTKRGETRRHAGGLFNCSLWTCEAHVAAVEGFSRGVDDGSVVHGPVGCQARHRIESPGRKHGWTLAEVSRRTALPTSTLSKLENDKMSIGFDKLSRISAGLGIDISALFGGDNIPDRQKSTNGRRSLARASAGKAIETRNYCCIYPAWDLLNKRIITGVVSDTGDDPAVADFLARETALP
jgi:transcriptional regulator with XRE-family HTH domain